MTDWWSGMETYSKVLFIVGAIFTLFMLLQMVLIFVGNDSGLDIDGDGIPDELGIEIFGLKMLSVRAVVAFVSVGAWVIYILKMLEVGNIAATLIGLGVGVLAAFGVAYIMTIISRLQSSGNFDMQRTVGKAGEVYLTIPANKLGVGKVTLHLEDRFVEFDAMTDNANSIPTTTPVKVVSMLGDNILMVDRL